MVEHLCSEQVAPLLTYLAANAWQLQREAHWIEEVRAARCGEEVLVCAGPSVVPAPSAVCGGDDEPPRGPGSPTFASRLPAGVQRLARRAELLGSCVAFHRAFGERRAPPPAPDRRQRGASRGCEEGSSSGGLPAQGKRQEGPATQQAGSAARQPAGDGYKE